MNGRQHFSYLLTAGVVALLPMLPAEEAAIMNSIGMQLIRVEPGTFVMGQDGPATDYHMAKHPEEFAKREWDEWPAHEVTISQAFYIGATEVTLGQWREYQEGFRNDGGEDDEAVRDISWFQATKFCDWLSEKEGRRYRLPTEAEWEYACRAGSKTLFSTGDTLPPGFQKWFREENGRSRYFPDGRMPPEYRHVPGIPTVKTKETKPNAWGLFDMHGNVSEWCADWYGPFEAGAQTDPLGRSHGDFRVFRGGAHSNFSRLLRSANRAGWIPEARHSSIGFRVVLGEAPKGKLLPPSPTNLHGKNVSQSVAGLGSVSPETPIFSGPKPFVIIPPDSHGPLFSWHNHSPAITESPNGDLLASWFSCVDEGGPELNNLASRLRLGKTEWEPATVFWDGPDINDHAPKLWWDGQETIFHLARGLSENILRTSTDNGATWSKAKLLQPFGEFGNQLIRLSDGRLAITHDQRNVGLCTSRDHGETWEAVFLPEKENAPAPGQTGGRPPGIHAPFVELKDGRLMAFSRQDPPEAQARFHGKMPVSYSSDGGRTWTFAESEFPAVSSAQRPVLLRLQEGPLLFCSFTDLGAQWKSRKGLKFQAANGKEFTGYGLFAAVSYDEGKTWPDRRVITPGGTKQTLPTIDRGLVEFSDTMSEPTGYLAVTQTRDGRIQLLSSKNHYIFNLAWLRQFPKVGG